MLKKQPIILSLFDFIPKNAGATGATNIWRRSGYEFCLFNMATKANANRSLTLRFKLCLPIINKKHTIHQLL